jgi:hypothetical protein
MLAWFACLLGTALASALVLLETAQYGRHAYFIVFGSAALASAPGFLHRAIGRTTLTPEGLSTRSLIARRSCRWEEVVSITTHKTTGRGASLTRIVVNLRSGEPFHLAAPYDLSTRRDRSFEQRLAVITAYLEAHGERGAGGPG